VGVVGSWAVRPKGIPAALAGLALARQRGLELEVWRASAEPLEAAERALGVTSHYRQRLSTCEMGAFYRQLDALVFPSLDEEGFGLPVLEAMACGLAVAASDIAPLRAVPQDALLRFTPGDPEAVADAVARLLEPSTRRRLASHGRRWATTMTPDRMVDRVLAALVAEGAPPPARSTTTAPRIGAPQGSMST
jgi:glycosyltransferase involved in cell wall biosynthesis